MRACFISDLHLYSGRTTAGTHHDLIQQSIDQSQLAILGGDLFDFRWSVYRDRNHTVDLAMDWLHGLLDANPHSRFLYLAGNHDNKPEFVDAILRFQTNHPTFTFAGDCIQIADAAFLHGDCVDVGGCPQALAHYRTRWGRKPRRGMVASSVYDVAVNMQMHRVVAATAHSRRSVARKLLQYLGQCGVAPARGLRRVVFGHTHRYSAGFEYKGTRFYNPGATIRGVPFHPILIDVDPTAVIQYHRSAEWHELER